MRGTRSRLREQALCQATKRNGFPHLLEGYARQRSLRPNICRLARPYAIAFLMLEYLVQRKWQLAQSITENESYYYGGTLSV